MAGIKNFLIILVLSLAMNETESASNCRAIFKNIPSEIPLATFGDCEAAETILFVALPLFETSTNDVQCGAPGSVARSPQELVLPEIVNFVLSEFPPPRPSVAAVAFATCGAPYQFISRLHALVNSLKVYLAAKIPPDGSISGLKRIVVVGEDDSMAVVSFLADGLAPFVPVPYVNFRSNDVTLTEQPHLFQSVPNANDFLSAFHLLLKAYQWSNIGVIIQDSPYWEALAVRFYGILAESPNEEQIHVAYRLKIYKTLNDQDILQMLKRYVTRFFVDSEVGVVIVFGGEEVFQKVMKQEAEIRRSSITWLLFQETLPFLRKAIDQNLPIANDVLGSLIVAQSFGRLPNNFNTHLRDASNSSVDNPFLEMTVKKQSEELKSSSLKYVDYDKFSYYDDHTNIYDGIDSILHALSIAERNKCPINNYKCFTSAILSSIFISISDNQSQFAYNLQGLARVPLNILNINEGVFRGDKSIAQVGRYHSRQLDPPVPKATFYRFYFPSTINSDKCSKIGCGSVNDLITIQNTFQFDLPLQSIDNQIDNVAEIHLMLNLRDEGGNFLQENMENLLAFDWVVQNINLENTILPGVPIVVKAFDTFGNGILAESITRSVILGQGAFISPVTKPRETITLAIVGDSNPLSSKGIHAAIKDLNVPVPQIAITDDPEFNTRHRYPHFIRAIPSKTAKIEVLLSVLEVQKWNSIHLLRDSSATSVRLAMLLMEKIQSGTRRICVASDNQLQSSDVETVANMERVLVKMMSNERAFVVVSLLNPARMVSVMFAAKNADAFGRLYWIGVDDWFDQTSVEKVIKEASYVFTYETYMQQLLGSVVIVPKKIINTPFLKYYRSLKLSDLSESPNLLWKEFFSEFWMENFQCNMNGNFKFDRTCSGAENLDSPKTVYKSTSVEAMMQVAIMLARSFSYLLRSKCVGVGICQDVFDSYRSDPSSIYSTLMERMEQDSFKVDYLSLRTFALMDRNSSADIYTIMNLQEGPLRGTFKTVDVADFQIGLLRHKQTAQVYGLNGTVDLDQKCKAIPACAACTADEQSVDEEKLDKDLAEAFAKLERAGYETDGPWFAFFGSRPWGLGILSVAAPGFLASFACLSYFLFDFKNPVHVQSSGILNYLLNTGIGSMFLLTLGFMVSSTDKVCFFRRLVFAPLHALVFSCLLVKSVRNARIDRKSHHYLKDIPYVYAESQALFVLALTTFQIVLNVEWVALVPSSSVFLLSSPSVPVIPPRWSCACDGVPFYIINLYPMLLLTATTIHSWIKRGARFASMETKYICAASTLISIAWILWTAWYFTAEGENRLFSVCALLVVEATSIFVLLFVVKLAHNLKTLEERMEEKKEEEVNKKSTAFADEKKDRGKTMRKKESKK